MVERMPPDSTDTIYPIKRYSDQAAKKLSNFVVPKRHTGKERLKRSRANNNLYPVPRGKMILNTVRLQGRYRNTLSLRACMLILVVFAATTVVEAEGLDEPAEFDIPAQGLDSALLAFSEQGKIQVVVSTDAVSGRETDGVEGEHTPREALEHLLANAGLTYSTVGLETVAVSAAEDESPGKAQAASSAILMAQASTNDKTDPAEESTDSPTDEAADRRSHTVEFDASTGRFEILDEIVVRGSKRNLGIRRSEDDFQPYVVINKEEISRSGVDDLDDFLRTRLPSNFSPGSNATSSSASNASLVNLRGLGVDETLILINGRRAPRVIVDGNFTQGDLNGIPLEFIERIEVLPATASGIYGGGATGGVINIVLRSDYKGLTISASYDNTFDTDSAIREITATGGWSLEDGKTNVLFSASYSDSNELLAGDRPFLAESRAAAIRNAPDRVLDGPAPPQGSTTNIRGLLGPLVFDDGRELGSDRTFVPIGYAGFASDNGELLLQNAGQFNLDFPQDASFGGARTSLLNNPEVYSLSLNVTREMTSWLGLYVDSLYRVNEGRFQVSDSSASRFVVLPGDAPSNPFDNFLIATIPLVGLEGQRVSESKTLQIATGFIATLPNNWGISGDVSWTDSESDFASTNPLTNSFLPLAYIDGSVDVFSDLNAFLPDYSDFFLSQPASTASGEGNSLDISLRASGPLFELSGGAVSGSFLVQRLSEEQGVLLSRTVDESGNGDFILGAGSPAESTVNSIYGEFLVPIIGPANARPGFELLEVTLAGRYDDYEAIVASDFLSSRQVIDLTVGVQPFDLRTIDYSGEGFTFGVRYSPIDAITLRTSFATGFKPPTVRELQPWLQEDIFGFIADPERGGTFLLAGPFDRVVGGNIDLEPEESETLSVGVILTPPTLPNLRFSVDYIAIDKNSEISGTVDEEFVLENIEDFPERVQRDPLEPDAPPNFTAGPITFLDVSSINLAATSVRAIDFQADYLLETDRFGEFDFSVIGTRNLEFSIQNTPESDVVEFVDKSGSPIKWQGNIAVDWQKDQWKAGWNAQYVGSYSVLSSFESMDDDRTADRIELVGQSRVPSQVFHDAYVGYRFDDWNAEVAVTVRNIFEQYEVQPEETSSVGLWSPFDPRLRTYKIRVRKSF